MTITLFAQPYDISAVGFYFESAEDYDTQAAKVLNDFGQKVEEFEIQFIDGNALDCALARTWNLHQGNFAPFLDAVEDWDDEPKYRYIIAVGECGYSHEQMVEDKVGPEIVIYHVANLRELAEQFVDDGWFGEIPWSLDRYIDYGAIARDLSIEFSEIDIAGERLVYACQ